MKKEKQHCPEVEKLMNGHLPFITRYGITLVVVILIVVSMGLFYFKKDSRQLIKEVWEHTITQINIRI